jgi:hypothetical protein
MAMRFSSCSGPSEIGEKSLLMKTPVTKRLVYCARQIFAAL